MVPPDAVVVKPNSHVAVAASLADLPGVLVVLDVVSEFTVHFPGKLVGTGNFIPGHHEVAYVLGCCDRLAFRPYHALMDVVLCAKAFLHKPSQA